MYRAIPYALLAMAVLAIGAVMASFVDTTQFISDLGSAFTSAVGLSREIYRRTLMSIPFDYSLIDRARVLAGEQLHTIRHAAEEVLVPYIDACHAFVTDSIKKSDFFRSAEESRLPQPSIESITYHPQSGSYPRYGSYAWDIPSTRFHPDPGPNTSTLFFVLATNFCTAMLCFSIISAISISSAILAASRFVWRSTKRLARLPDMPEVAWDTIINTLCHFLAKLAAGGMNMMCVCLASLIFCIVNTIVWAANLNIGFKLARLEIPPPQVIYRTLEDPRVPKLQEENRRIHNQVVDKDALLENTRTRYDTDVGELEREIETLEGANLAQKAVIRGQLKMLASIDMTRSTYDQLKEKEKRAVDLQKEKDLAIEDKKQSEAYFLKQLGDQFETIRTVRWELRVEKQEHALLRKEHACCQGQLDSREAISGLNIKSQRKRIQDLEKSMASKEETLQALLKEHEELIASQKAAKDAFEEQLKERDEIINTQKKAIQDLHARMNEQEESHASQKKSESASIKRKFDEEIKKMTDECNRSSDARKAAEEMLKTEKEARKAAEEALDTERKGRKAADEKLKAEEDAHKAAEQACEVAQQQSEADSKALKKVQADLEDVRAELDVEENAQNSANQKLLVEIEAREAAEAEVASLRARLATRRPHSNDEGTQTSNPPPSPGKIASDDKGTQTSGGSSETEQPEAVNPTPAEGSPVEPASRSGEQCEAPGQPEASESNSA